MNDCGNKCDDFEHDNDDDFTTNCSRRIGAGNGGNKTFITRSDSRNGQACHLKKNKSENDELLAP